MSEPRQQPVPEALNRDGADSTLTTGWLIAAFAPAVLTALLLLGLAATPLPLLSAMTTDSQGDIYGLFAAQAYRFDKTGHAVLVGDRMDLEDPGVAGEIRVGPDGAVYVADLSTGAAGRFGAPDGEPTTLASGMERIDPLVRGPDLHAGANVSVSPDATGAYVLARGTLFRFDLDGSRKLVAERAGLTDARSVETEADGALLIADTQYGRILRVSRGATQTVDCLGAAEGYRYPMRLRVSPAGDIYAVLGRLRGSAPERGEPLSPGQSGQLLPGRLYRVDFSSGRLESVDVKSGRMSLKVRDVGFIRDDVLVVSVAGSDWLYRFDLSQSGNATRIEEGALGRMSRTASVLRALDDSGIPLLFVCGIGLPIVIASTGALIRSGAFRTTDGRGSGSD